MQTSHIAQRKSLPPLVIRRALREASGLTQRELAMQLGVARETVSRWEAGTRIPKGDKRAAYAQALRELLELVS